MPLVAAFAGWALGRLFLFCLFHPAQPVNILGFRIQGFVPRRQDRIAAGIGRLAGRQTDILKDSLSSIDHASGREALFPFLESHIDHFLRHKLGREMPMIGMFIGDKTIDALKDIFMKELEEVFPQAMERYLESLPDHLDIERMIRQKISAIPPARLESYACQLMGGASRSISLLTAAVGLVVGLLYLTFICISNF